jgi:hypothetical protein
MRKRPLAICNCAPLKKARDETVVSSRLVQVAQRPVMNRRAYAAWACKAAFTIFGKAGTLRMRTPQAL